MTSSSSSPGEDFPASEKSAASGVIGVAESISTGDVNVPRSHDTTHRQLKERHVQLIGIGGTIGTALFVAIGRGLALGGPASLFLGFTLWSTVVLCVNNCLAEMVSYLPISSPFIRFAGRFVDEAFGVATGYNFFIFEAMMVPFEIVATIKWYGEAEFWMALGKVILIVGLLIFTFITMLGGNPLHDRFGFRYWSNPGAFAEFYHTGSLGRFMGFLACFIQASFTIAGPDYVAMAAGETQNPRKTLPRAFKGVFFRLTTFFVLGSLAVGVLVPYNSKDLVDIYLLGKPTAGAAGSPYVLAMQRLQIGVLPHIVNALVFTSALSAGNSTNKVGVPIYCVGLVMCFSLLAFLQLSAGTAQVLNWFIGLVTSSQLMNYAVCSFTYIKFHRACIAQGLDRKGRLPFCGMFQPYAAYYSLFFTFVMTFVGGFTVFLPGFWSLPTFFFSYTMPFMFPVIFLIWKFTKGTTWKRSIDVDLVEGLDEIEAYERTIPEKKKKKAETTGAFEKVQQTLFRRVMKKQNSSVESNLGKGQ
ncbi:hypothetical protein TWF106_008076 [Orbilia oligospora]|uniref:Amino acid permease/ SLC12A domain-containing protein n=1 Tax=Orbilia oligospora TaxID=2813651 RepID=A0A7C8QKD9_ORBOL|nr:hypothetical protein TWF788_005747 [Orbilia oligospora]KAF3209619.1 hypothetical protein TWF191_011390 [Orbilia oligospora]KAF3214849.1 hypothetical protein TWF679_004629 [Orbilia oligospora]KAF3217026.1 hypothetical protein TWF106_008076 [Orbilia oligospora]